MRKLLGLSLLLLIIILVSCGKKEDKITIELKEGFDTVEVNGTWVDKGAIYTNGEDEIIIYSEDTVDTTILGTVEVTYNITLGDTTFSATRYVTILDQTMPVLVLLEGIDTIVVNSTWTDSGCEVTDNSGETLTCTTVSIFDTTTIGIYAIVYTATDSSGNTGTATRYLNVVE